MLEEGCKYCIPPFSIHLCEFATELRLSRSSHTVDDESKLPVLPAQFHRGYENSLQLFEEILPTCVEAADRLRGVEELVSYRDFQGCSGSER